MAKVRAGIMACEGQRCESHDHNAPVVVFKNEKETLSYSCDWCGRAPYARKGTGQHAEWVEAMQHNAPKQEQAGAGKQEISADEVEDMQKRILPEKSKAQEKKPAKTGSGTFFG